MKKLGKKGEGYVVIQFILIGLIFFAPEWISFGENWAQPFATISLILGIIFIIVGGLLAVAGVLNLGANLTAVPHPKENSQLVQTGAYAFVRHPIYAGIILGTIGWGLFNTSLLSLALAIILLLFFDVKSRQEELWLSEKYSDYSEYQKRVKKLLPYVY